MLRQHNTITPAVCQGILHTKIHKIIWANAVLSELVFSDVNQLTLIIIALARCTHNKMGIQPNIGHYSLTR
jgi:hypothetical protein